MKAVRNGEIHERKFTNHIWAAGRTGGLPLRNESDERMSAEGRRGKDEKHTVAADEKSGDGRSRRSSHYCSTAEQQRYHCYGDRLRQRRSDDSASGDIYHPWREYRDDDDGSDYRVPDQRLYLHYHIHRIYRFFYLQIGEVEKYRADDFCFSTLSS